MSLRTIQDHIRYAVSRFREAQLSFGHGQGTALDEAAFLVLEALHLPHDLPPGYATAALTDDECAWVQGLIARRVTERVPAAYLVGRAWFAGLSFKVDARVLVPRSPIAELIEQGFSPWFDARPPQRVLDLCTGSGCIAIALAMVFPDAKVDASDLSPDALDLAQENLQLHQVESRVRLLHSDLFDDLHPEHYDLIVSNPPYVSEAEWAALPAEYRAEPAVGLLAGRDGLEHPLRILRHAAGFLADGGLLVVEVGASGERLVNMLPTVPFTWLEFAHSDDGVFAITREELVAARALIEAAWVKRSRGVRERQ